MRFRDFVKLQSETCTNSLLKGVWLQLYEVFDESKPYSYPWNETTSTNQKKAKEVFDKVLKQKQEDNIENKKIWIMNFYSAKELEEKGLKDSDNVQVGYKSVISDDIISENGDEYVYLGKSSTYKFYLFKDVYYMRTIGATTLNRVTEFNYDSVAEYIEFLDYK
jgi:hypothetical protein